MANEINTRKISSPHPVNELEARAIVDVVSRKFDLGYVELVFADAHADHWGLYNPNTNVISLHGEDGQGLRTLLHELAHAIHESRQPGNRVAHNVTFHRICFEVRDWFAEHYGLDVTDINGPRYRGASFETALWEWHARRQAAA